MSGADPTVPIAAAYADRFNWTILDYPSMKKFSTVDEWQFTKFRSTAQLALLERRNFGLLCGKPSAGTIAVDFDVAAIEDLFRELFPELVATRQHRSPGHNCHHYIYRLSDPDHCPTKRGFQYYTGETTPDGKEELIRLADMIGEGGQVVLPGSIHPNGKQYTVEADIDPMVIDPGQLSEVCEWLQMECDKRDAKKRKEAENRTSGKPSKSDSDGRVEWIEFESAVMGLHDDRAHDVDQWWRVGAAIHSVDPGERGRQLFLEFSRKCSAKFTEKNCQSRWRRWERGGFGVTAKTVFKWAWEDGWKPVSNSHTGLAGGLLSHNSLLSQPTVAQNGSDETPFPSPAAPAAYYGLAGDFVRIVSPHSESDPMALLIQFLVAAGCLMGREPYFQVEGDRHYPNLFAALVGATAKGRKGTSWSHVRNIATSVDADWALRGIAGGLSSGEGLIWAVRDPVEKRKPKKSRNQRTEYEVVVEDEGVADKRLLVMEPELALVLSVIQRQGNTLSELVRQAWDTGNMRTLTKNSPVNATGAHISIIGHITREELLRNLETTECANGFANRYLWLAVKRLRFLALGGNLQDVQLDPIRRRLIEAIQFGMTVGRVDFDEEAKVVWCEVYPALAGDRPGLLGAVLSRAEAQTRRLALIFAVLDQSTHVRLEHLHAALAVFEYCESSSKWIFGRALGDPVADAIADALRAAGSAGLSRSEISKELSHHAKKDQIGRALDLLRSKGLAAVLMIPTGGRSEERWFASGMEREKSELSEKRGAEQSDVPGEISENSEKRVSG